MLQFSNTSMGLHFASHLKSALLTEYEEEADWAGEVTDSLAEVFASDKTTEIHPPPLGHDVGSA